MSNSGKEILSYFVILCAPAVFIIAADGMLRGEEPFYSWFYCFAWWSYIAFMEAFLCHRGGASMLFDYPGRFFLQLSLSIIVWLVFETFNFRLHNWHYINIVSDRPTRWLGYAISYATVLPGIFITARVLEYRGVLSSVSSVPLEQPGRLYVPFVAAGSISLILPLLWPRFFFPLVWLGFIFLLEPLNHRLRSPSLLADLERGNPRRIYLLLISGAVCGLLWELWNFWAGFKWVYTIPYIGWPKIFEMPVLGFLGFPPFALECYIMASSFSLLDQQIRKKLSRKQQILAWGGLGAAALLFSMLVFSGIDHFTVVSWK